MKNSQKLYLDSCSFIDLVKEQVGLLPSERDKDAWHLKQLMKAHQQRDVVLHTSFLAVAECVAVESGNAAVPLDIQDRFRRLLTSGQYVSLLAPTPKTAQIAQNLRWKHGIVLGGPDVLHIAAALESGCVEFLTTDDRLQKAKLAAALPKLRNIGLSAIRPSATAYLPDAYRQGDMLGKNIIQ